MVICHFLFFQILIQVQVSVHSVQMGKVKTKLDDSLAKTNKQTKQKSVSFHTTCTHKIHALLVRPCLEVLFKTTKG